MAVERRMAHPERRLLCPPVMSGAERKLAAPSYIKGAAMLRQ